MSSSPPRWAQPVANNGNLIEPGPGFRSGLRDLPAHLNVSTVGAAPGSARTPTPPTASAVFWTKTQTPNGRPSTSTRDCQDNGVTVVRVVTDQWWG